MLRSRSTRRRAIPGVAAVVLALVATPLGALPVAAAPTPLGVNLVRNPGAEAGAGTNGYTTVAIPGWDVIGDFTVVRYGSPEFPTKAESARIGGGRKFFSCGPNEDAAFIQQSVAIKARAARIDAGSIRITMKVRLAGYLNGSDWGRFVVTYFNAADEELMTSSLVLPGGTNGLFLIGKQSRPVPAGTRRLSIGLFGERANDGGSYCDVYFDKVSVVLEAID